MRQCTTCQRELSNDSFWPSMLERAGAIRCKECAGKVSNAYKGRSKDKARDWHLKNKYGISLEEYEEMLQAQDGRCAICGMTFDLEYIPDSPRVDHNHTTGAVRELLCQRCNTGIGMLQESEDILTSAIDYLRRHNELS